MTTNRSTSQFTVSGANPPGLTPELVLKVLGKHWVAATAIAVAVLLATAFYTLGQTKIYQATATVQIDPNPTMPLGKDVSSVVDVGVGSFWSNKEYYATQQQLLQGRALALATVERLGLQRDGRFLANVAPEDPDPPPPENPVTPEAAAGVLSNRLTVEPVKDSRLVTVSLDDADPERARRVLKELLDVYLERNIGRVVASTESASEWLNEQTGKLKEELEKTELSLHEYKKDKRILSVSLDDQSNMLREEMQQLNHALTEVQTRRQGLVARYSELEKIDATDPDNVPASELLSNPLLTNLRAEYIEAKGVRASLLAGGKGEQHPSVTSAEARVATAREALLNEIGNVRGAVKSDLDAVSKEVKGLAGLFEEAKQRALDLNLLEIEYRRLERSKKNTEKLYGLVLERSKESDLAGLMRFNNISVVEPPRSSRSPVRPNVPIYLALGGMLGIALGLGFAFARELLDRRVRSPEDLEETVGLPFFGMLPSASRGAHRRRGRVEGDAGSPELYAHQAPSGAVAEAARGIRTSLTFSAPDRPYRRFLVTSASPGDGKTMVASTLAVALAQTGARVLLLDCDLRRSRLHRVFGRTNHVGVSNAVLDHDVLRTEVLDTTVTNLSLLPAGPRVAAPAELLQSERFVELLDELGRLYDMVVIDSPPVIAVTDALIVATRVDAVMFVARAGRTRRDLARRAVRDLRAVGANVAGCVLNDLDVERRGYGYYYYYYRSGYGYGGKEGASSGEEAAA